MENEIQNNEEKVVAQNATNKESCAKTLFSAKNLSYLLVIASLCFAFLNKFIAYLAHDSVVYAIFFFISFGLALSAFIIDLICKINKHETKFDFSMILSMFAMAISIL